MNERKTLGTERPCHESESQNIGLPGLFINSGPDEFSELEVAICEGWFGMAVQSTEKR